MYGIRRVYYTENSEPGEIKFKMEKVSEMTTTHVSSGIRNICDKKYTIRDLKIC